LKKEKKGDGGKGHATREEKGGSESSSGKDLIGGRNPKGREKNHRCSQIQNKVTKKNDGPSTKQVCKDRRRGRESKGRRKVWDSIGGKTKNETVAKWLEEYHEKARKDG